MHFLFFASIILTVFSWINLNFNENNRGPSEKVQKTIEMAISDVNRYPDYDHEALIKQIADYHSVTIDQVFLSNGLNSIMRNITETMLGSGKNLIIAYPSYDYLQALAQNQGTEIIKVSLRSKDYAHDLEHMLEAITPSTGLVYICNPNNPTGSITPREEIDRFLARLPSHVHVFIDEAYHHYATEAKGYVSFLDKPIENDRVMVGRTFSKAYGIAGLRIGYLIGSPAIIAALKKNDCIDQVSVPALRAAATALQDEEGLREMVQLNTDARIEFYRQLEARGLKWIPSHTNFVMMEIGEGSVDTIISYYKKHQMRVGRKFIETHMRVTLGLPEEMRLFWRLWDTKDSL